MRRKSYPVKSTPKNINREFLEVFTEIEQLLKSRINPASDSHESVSKLILKYAKINPYWSANAGKLQGQAKIRNILTHQNSLEHGAPFTVKKACLRSLLEIQESLKRQILVSEKFKKPVTCVAKYDSLESVVRLAFEKGFSQFPVLDGDRFKGLITEAEIVRWLGRNARKDIRTIDLLAVQVSSVLPERDPYKKDMPIYHFEKLDAYLPEVMSWFVEQPVLEAVLLTKSGTNRTPIEGIVTQWDSARYFN